MTTELLKSEATQMLMTRKEEARATICFAKMENVLVFAGFL